MNVLNYESTYGAQDESGAAYGIDSNLSLHFVRGFGVKGFEAQSAELSGLAAAGPWRFTRTNLNLVAELVSLQLAGMDSSSVVATGSNCSPRADSFAWRHDGQGVSNVDVDDLVPTNGNRGERVREDHALIEDFNLWSNENQVRSDAAGNRPKAARDGWQGFFGQPQGYGKKKAEGKYQSGQYVATARSKNLSITHVSIIAGDK
jgi:hypothetical protein